MDRTVMIIGLSYRFMLGFIMANLAFVVTKARFCIVYFLHI